MIIENSPNVKFVSNGSLDRMFEVIADGSIRETFNGVPTEQSHDNMIYVIDLPKHWSGYSEFESVYNTYKEHGHVYDVTRTGLPNTESSEEVGSTRFCTNSLAFVRMMNGIIQNSCVFPETYKGEKFFSVSPYLRCMLYQNGGMHFPHYDSDYEFQNDKTLATRYSLVMYLTDNDSGEIAFIDDKTEWKETQSDWDRQATDDEIFLKLKPKAGRIVLFPHDLCHSVLELTDDKPRAMIRGDVIFTKNNGGE